MKRHVITPRKDWEKSVEAGGLIWHTASDGKPYWDESAYYSFTLKQVEEIEQATNRVQELFAKAGEIIIHDDSLMQKFGIPKRYFSAIRDSWDDDAVALNYGRFDFGYDGVNPPKLFEYNCDTPTSLLEAAVIQWNWKEDVFHDHDQFNNIHDSLVGKWRSIKNRLKTPYVHFAHIADDAGEDILNTAYMADVAQEAGLEAVSILMDQIGYSTFNNQFSDLNHVHMQSVYKLYPWEWLMNEEIGDCILDAGNKTQWIEPMWKAIWSNKAILPILHEMFPYHPNLLPCYDKEPAMGHNPAGYNFVRKPILSREGANVTIVKDGIVVAESEGKYSTAACVFQEMFAIPDFGGSKFPIIGSWVVDGESVGMGIREDGLITGNTARFIPHIIEG